MRFMQGVFLLSLGLLIAFGACRRNQPTLVDKNQAPDTELWYAPPDSSEYEYRVHLYWRGVDSDGTATRFIWAIKDSIITGEEAWNPADKLRDFRQGRMTTRTDSIFSFTAFKEISGLGVKKNRQAFLIAAIDDNGVIDQSPAWTEFIATIDQLPTVQFWTKTYGDWEPYVHRDPPIDTVGTMHPFEIRYHGTTRNGVINAYRYYPLTSGVYLEGQDVWHDAVTDTVTMYLPNSGDDLLPAKTFKLAVQARDGANAISHVDAAPPHAGGGVCQVVVNFDPQTQFLDVLSTYHTPSGMASEYIDFTDGIPDTVPYKSFVRIHYWGADDPRDEPLNCDEILDPNSCIKFNVAYRFNSPYSSAANEFSLWQPRAGYHDTDPHSSTDSNTFYIGSLNYELYARAVDEFDRPDGTPPSVKVIGNFVPTLDSVAVVDHLGNSLDLSIVDTLRWNFFKGIGWPYQCRCDTVDFDQVTCGGLPSETLECKLKQFPGHTGSLDFIKTFAFYIKAWGHDNPKDPPPSVEDAYGSGVKAWTYQIMNEQMQVVDLGSRSILGWFEQKNSSGGLVMNTMTDGVTLKILYPGPYSGNPDPNGDTVFANLPGWLGHRYTFILKARDTRLRSSTEFKQTIFINGKPSLINSFSDSSLGRQTKERVFAFRVEMVR
jgi:hypothetical protein